MLKICAASGNNWNSLPGVGMRSRSLLQHMAKYGSLDLLATRIVEDRIKASPWDNRAWTFQERLLSRRCLIFVDDRMFFQCRESIWSEEVECETSQPTWTLDMIGASLALFNENPVRRYCIFVELYSGRALTYSRDRLVAWDGIASTLAPSLQPNNLVTKFHFGLPASHFAMLWEPMKLGSLHGLGRIGTLKWNTDCRQFQVLRTTYTNG